MPEKITGIWTGKWCWNMPENIAGIRIPERWIIAPPHKKTGSIECRNSNAGKNNRHMDRKMVLEFAGKYCRNTNTLTKKTLGMPDY
jgi:hypothetical protein